MTTGEPEFNRINSPSDSLTKEQIEKQAAQDFLSKQEHIKEIKYEDVGVSEEEFSKALEKSNIEPLQKYTTYFLKYLQGPVIKDDFNDDNERRKWGMEVLNKLNYEAGQFYKSNKVKRTNFRRLDDSFSILEIVGISGDEVFKKSNDLQQEMHDLIGESEHYNSLSFDEKKVITDKASEFARSVCNALIEMFGKN